MVAAGAVRIDAPAERLLEVLRDIQKFESGSGFLKTVRISDPPRAADFAALSLPAEDVADLRQCRPGDCDVKLGERAFEQLTKIDRQARDADAQIQQFARRMAFDAVEGYRKRGNAAFGRVARRAPAASRGRRVRSDAGRPRPWLTRTMPGLADYLARYPNAPKPEGMEEYFYWSFVEFGLKTVLRVNHVVLYPSPGGGPGRWALANRQIYASHYFQNALEVRLLVDDPAQQGRAHYLMVLNVARPDGTTGLFGGLVRYKIRSGSREALRKTLVGTKQRCETGRGRWPAGTSRHRTGKQRAAIRRRSLCVKEVSYARSLLSQRSPSPAWSASSLWPTVPRPPRRPRGWSHVPVDWPARLWPRQRAVCGRHAGGHHRGARPGRRRGSGRRQGRRRPRPEDRRAAGHRRRVGRRDRHGRAAEDAQRVLLGDARPGRRRQGRRSCALDGSGTLSLVALDTLRFSRAALPNAPVAAPTERRNPRTQSITDMVFHDGQLLVAGLSNEEFASKLRAVKYPFAAVDPGTSVEIYHGNHGQLETRSPVYTLVPYTVDGTPHLIAGYLCTPLVKFPMASLQAGGKIRGTTIAELGNRNRPIDMFVYQQGGKDFLLMSNTSRGVMKIPTEPVCDGRAHHRAGRGEGGRAVRDDREPEGRRADGPVRPAACHRPVPHAAAGPLAVDLVALP